MALFYMAYSSNYSGLIGLLEALFGLTFLIYYIREKKILAIAPISAYAVKAMMTGIGNYMGVDAWQHLRDS